MGKFFMKVLVNAGAFYLAIYFLRPNIVMQNEAWYAYLAIAVIFGLVNSLIRPVVMFISCPLIILTLGLGTLIINTALFLFSGWLGTVIGIGFTIPQNRFMYAFLGALIVSVISFIANRLFLAEKKN